MSNLSARPTSRSLYPPTMTILCSARNSRLPQCVLLRETHPPWPQGRGRPWLLGQCRGLSRCPQRASATLDQMKTAHSPELGRSPFWEGSSRALPDPECLPRRVRRVGPRIVPAVKSPRWPGGREAGRPVGCVVPKGAPMKITSVDVGCVAASGRERRVVTVRAKVGQPQESLELRLLYPTRAMIRRLGNAASREQRTSLVNLGLFPERPAASTRSEDQTLRGEAFPAAPSSGDE
jgi:hypothetical protein